MNPDGNVLELRGLTVNYGTGRRRGANAVHGVDLAIPYGQTLALVGESGSGKSTIGNAVLGLTPVSGGTIRFDGRDITRVPARERRALTAQIQAVFQDPYGSLNPVRTIRQTLVEPLLAHGRPASRATIAAALHDVGLEPGAAQRFPAEFSGGQRQRIAIARALMVQPRLVVCDEPTSALDLSVQAQVVNLLRRLQREHGLAYLFITHDLALVRHVAHRVVVLYQGRVMESGPVDQVCGDPRHPYTRALLAAAPVPDPVVQRRRAAPLAPAVATAPVTGGCPFAPRCPYVADECRVAPPPLVDTGDGRYAACVRLPDITPAPVHS